MNNLPKYCISQFKEMKDKISQLGHNLLNYYDKLMQYYNQKRNDFS